MKSSAGGDERGDGRRVVCSIWHANWLAGGMLDWRRAAVLGEWEAGEAAGFGLGWRAGAARHSWEGWSGSLAVWGAVAGVGGVLIRASDEHYVLLWRRRRLRRPLRRRQMRHHRLQADISRQLDTTVQEQGMAKV